MTDQKVKPTIVIVHGAWTDASSFAGVQHILTERGYQVLEFANPLRSLAGDAEYLTTFLETRVSGPVLLVGHSYGGALIGAAGLRAPNVRGLVYVNAFVPAAGESLLELLNSAGPVDPGALFDMAPYPGAPEGDLDLYIKRVPFEPAFATGLSEELQAEFYAKQRPITFSAVGAPASDGQAWEKLPSWYVAGSLDGSIPLSLQLRMADRAGSTVTTVESGHLSMVTHPQAVADVIVEAATNGPS
ncbi:alpha/beta hydrolase [Rhodococcus fascians]|nr:alpha/beta hydrolase [Rhodococcus fascians]MBY3998496.1 alpha/beta hydrolase [Rhodococcus fascians]MBY4004510.1 alpha/beta hydrolase [Rhodococcus fascians]MBY4009309.1 alpha/beta hydrolase [Rhodococcus fascians]MBY4019717.1 alpha/beta hydrolase [Rhodococcus fascians]